jgi:hypothetical protein
MQASNGASAMRSVWSHTTSSVSMDILIEFWSGFTALSWAGLSVISNERLSLWPSMAVLLQICDERTWHVLAFCLGAAQLVFLVFRDGWLRWVTAVLISWFWALLALGLWRAAAISGDAPWLPWAALCAGWSGLNFCRAVLRTPRLHAR